MFPDIVISTQTQPSIDPPREGSTYGVGVLHLGLGKPLNNTASVPVTLISVVLVPSQNIIPSRITLPPPANSTHAPCMFSASSNSGAQHLIAQQAFPSILQLPHKSIPKQAFDSRLLLAQRLIPRQALSRSFRLPHRLAPRNAFSNRLSLAHMLMPTQALVTWLELPQQFVTMHAWE